MAPKTGIATYLEPEQAYRLHLTLPLRMITTPPLLTPWSDAAQRWAAWCDVTGAAWWGADSAHGLEQRQAERARSLLAWARQHSPLYARLYARVPADAPWSELPITTRSELMAQFDDWATDRAITRASVDEFLSRRDNLADDYLGRYAVWTSSGTCGQWGIFVQPRSALAVYEAELALRCAPGASIGVGVGRLPSVLIAALDAHYGGVVTWRRMQRATPWLAAQMHALSVKAPLDELVAQLNGIQPRFVAAYPSVLQALADEQARGRLHITPEVVWSGGEALTPAARAHITHALGGALINDYAASECMSIAFECPHGRMHLNADWVRLEAVDEHHCPVPEGTPSHTSLLTNLANPTQPLIRYDLGDSITAHSDPCPCGCPRPSFTVSGRAADVLHLPRRDGSTAVIFPLALQGVLEEEAGVTAFQIVQIAPERLQLRLAACHLRTAPLAQKARTALRQFLTQHGAPQVRIDLDTVTPCPECGSGKIRQVVALQTGPTLTSSNARCGFPSLR